MNDVLIIGAGAAGLAAARDIAAAHLPVIVLEARDRIGGRVYTLHDAASPVPVELGAEFVHGKHPALMQVLDESNIPFCDVTERHLYFDKGKVINSHEFWNELSALMDLMSLDHPDQTFKEFLASLPDNYVSRQASEVASLFVQGFHAGEINLIGTHGLVKAKEAEDAIDSDKGFRVLGGYEVLMQALHDEAAANGAGVRLQTVVKEIHWKANGVEVVCLCAGEQQRFTGSRVLITLPLAVLQAEANQPGAVRFIPELPEEKRNAIRRLMMGHALRITLVFRERFWEGFKKNEASSAEVQFASHGEQLSEFGFLHNPEAPLPTWWSLHPIHAPVLVGWSGGPDAERLARLNQNQRSAKQNDDELVTLALQSLAMTLGVSESQLRELLVSSHTHNWTSDPFTRGAYAYLPVGGLELQQALARSIDHTLYFAGEATSVGHIGTVHGALDSGHLAAQEILKS